MREGPLAIVVNGSHVGRREYGYVATVNSSNRMLKKRKELGVLTDLQWDSLASWERDIFGVEWWAGQYVEGIFEVATVHGAG